MRFRSTVKQFDNQQSSDTLHAKLSKGESGAICNISHLSPWYCSAFNPDCHFVEWRSLAGILISRHHYVSFEKTNGRALSLSKCLILLSPRGRKKMYLILHLLHRKMYGWLSSFRYRSPESTLFPVGLRYRWFAPRPEEITIQWGRTRLRDCGSLGPLSWLKRALRDPIRRVIRVMQLRQESVRMREE